MHLSLVRVCAASIVSFLPLTILSDCHKVPGPPVAPSTPPASSSASSSAADPKSKPKTQAAPAKPAPVVAKGTLLAPSPAKPAPLVPNGTLLAPSASAAPVPGSKSAGKKLPQQPLMPPPGVSAALTPQQPKIPPPGVSRPADPKAKPKVKAKETSPSKKARKQ